MIGTDKQQKIAALAWALWNDFLDFKGREFQSRQLLSPSVRTPSKISADFFRFCVQVCTQDGDAPEVSASIVSYDLADARKHARNRPASWLVMSYDARHNPCPTVVIDYETLHGKLAWFRALPTITRLVLHETGHLVLHWEQLQPIIRNGDLALAKSAAPIQEAEAWWFCISILGRVTAEVAEENARMPENADDQIWLDLVV
jgi:hypothetical protein